MKSVSARMRPGLAVAHVAAGDGWGGAEAQIVHLIAALRAGDVAVAAILFNDGELAARLRCIGAEVGVVPEAELNSAKMVGHLRRILRRIGPQVVHTHGPKANVLGAAAASWAGLPSLRTVHSKPVAAGAVARLNDLSARWLQGALVSVSDELMPSLCARYGNKAHLIENGIDLALYQAAASQRRYEDGRVHVGFAGRLVPIKRVDLFLAAAARLATARPGGFLFHVYGDGPERRGAEALAAELGVSGDVVFEGFVEDLAPRMALLDVLMLPSDHEGLPMALLEALAVGVPVVAHETGGMVRVIRTTGGGRLVAAHTPEGYAQAVAEVIEQRKSRPGWVADYQKKLERHYSIEITAGKYLSLYRELIRSAPRRVLPFPLAIRRMR